MVQRVVSGQECVKAELFAVIQKLRDLATYLCEVVLVDK